MSTGLATLIFGRQIYYNIIIYNSLVGAGSYILLKIPVVGRTIPNRYHTLPILGQ